jgi:hypothetical protein
MAKGPIDSKGNRELERRSIPTKVMDRGPFVDPQGNQFEAVA